MRVIVLFAKKYGSETEKEEMVALSCQLEEHYALDPSRLDAELSDARDKIEYLSSELVSVSISESSLDIIMSPDVNQLNGTAISIFSLPLCTKCDGKLKMVVDINENPVLIFDKNMFQCEDCDKRIIINIEN